MTETNRRWLLAARPRGVATEAHFRWDEAPLPAPGPGEVLVRTLYLSLDPYMRGRMDGGPSYAKSVEVGDVMTGGTVGQVIESRAEGLTPGDVVVGMGGWQSHAVLPAAEVRRVDPDAAPLSYHLGVLGMPGQTAYCGMVEIGKPRAGQTLVVGAASGAVGALVGQIAKIHGMRAVGVAGGAEKCAFVRNTLGFDACVDHRADGFEADLAAACPDGIDIYWENVGARTLWAALPLLNDFARVPVCGLIGWYNMAAPPEGPDLTPKLMRAILVKRLTLRGFIVWDFADRHGEAVETLAGWLRDGRLTTREDVVEGLERAPSAFLGLMSGANFGKLVVKVADRTG